MTAAVAAGPLHPRRQWRRAAAPTSTPTATMAMGLRSSCNGTTTTRCPRVRGAGDGGGRPDVLLTYDVRCLGLIAERFSLLHGTSAAAAKSKAKKGGRDAACLGRDGVASRASCRSSRTQRRSRARRAYANVGESRDAELTGWRAASSTPRALVCHQTHKLTSYSFQQASLAVLGADVWRCPRCSRPARACATAPRRRRRSSRCSTDEMLEETVEMAHYRPPAAHDRQPGADGPNREPPPQGGQGARQPPRPRPHPPGGAALVERDGRIGAYQHWPGGRARRRSAGEVVGRRRPAGDRAGE